MSQQTLAGQQTPGGAAPRRRTPGVRLVLFALLLAVLMAMLNNMIVATAMLSIVSDLGGMAHLSWVVTSYTLATAASTPIWGKLGDLYPRKRVFLIAIVFFVVGSVLCGLSQTMGQLIAFRAVQGVGAGGLLVGVMAIIGELIPPRERGRYQGLIASVMSVAMIGGPLIGGLLTDELSWRWAFHINLPLGAVAFTMVAIVLHLPAREKPEARIDYLGAVLLTVSISALVLLTSWGGEEYDWNSPLIISLGVLGAATLLLFLLAEVRAREPVLPLRLFRDGNFSLGTGMALVLGIVMFGAMLYLPIYYQAAQEQTATQAGVQLLPMLLSMMIVSIFVGRATTRTGRYRKYPIIGSLLLVTGLMLLATLGTDTHQALAAVFMAILGTGMGFLMQLTMLIPQNSVDVRDIGVASSTVTLFRTIGGAFGVALLGALFNSRVLSNGGGTTGDDTAQLDNETLAALPPDARQAYAEAVSSGIHIVFLTAGCIAVLALLAALCIKEVPLRTTIARDERPEGGASRGEEHSDENHPQGECPQDDRGCAGSDGTGGGAAGMNGAGAGPAENGARPGEVGRPDSATTSCS